MGIMSRSSMWVTVAVLVTMGVLPMLAMASDADPLQDFCVAYPSDKVVINGQPCKPPAEVTYKDFWSPALTKPGITKNPNLSNVTQAFVAQFPGLNTLGIGAARIDFAKGGINPPHTHPRATELLLVVKGELYVGFVDTTNKLFAVILREGELFVFPRGLVHFQLNVGNGPALAFAALNSQNPGTQQIAPALFTPEDIKDEVLEKGFRIDGKTVDFIQEQFRKT
ncbi:hypothetical protein M758_3G042400 [Ceratodon purpureus]|nr:hypothetical protein M758_3G042000 [Ceratodon purpureus]KAG0621703.1 hypothetical protein M758_3G042100 [Ceratodon purpureus]KAG0621704.1 hypothetical protein M758_3G042200 [Ceratodon purpureus]KAG0621705.1 hypothetical protein M758_3G042300 [Ceratodon purpureus]KAG0621706.1 hypothetical protein M758_3G042400 [Ceratodon purpureus]